MCTGMREQLLKEIADIIKDYRSGELPFQLDSGHVEKWVCQFCEEAQETILSETLHILRQWYFSNSRVDEFLDSVVDYLKREYDADSVQELIKDTVFLSNQTEGWSQKKLLHRLASRIEEQYGLELITTPKSQTKHYVYIDDGLYTGKRSRADLDSCLYWVPKNARLDAFYVVASANGLWHVHQKLDTLLRRDNITLKIHRWMLIYNDRFIRTDGNSTEYSPTVSCLWPDLSLTSCADIVEYCNYLKTIKENYEKRMYRVHPWANDKGIFTSLENRNVVEKEFLLKGIQILQHGKKENGLYPLGFNLWPSFGFGSFCAFDMNISNTCPVVLWWGNIEAKGDVLDNWYPLLPRRVNAREALAEAEDTQCWEENDSSDQYNMCPDCGSYFGIETDGGNGFCINCSWNH